MGLNRFIPDSVRSAGGPARLRLWLWLWLYQLCQSRSGQCLEQKPTPTEKP